MKMRIHYAALNFHNEGNEITKTTLGHVLTRTKRVSVETEQTELDGTANTKHTRGKQPTRYSSNMARLCKDQRNVL